MLKQSIKFIVKTLFLPFKQSFLFLLIKDAKREHSTLHLKMYLIFNLKILHLYFNIDIKSDFVHLFLEIKFQIFTILIFQQLYF